jgi:tRNA-splicing ligase RtcB
MAAFAAQRALPPRLEAITARHPTLAKNRFIEQLGSLGSGNHFIELCLDEEQRVWAMLHSGSRGTGNLIGRYFIERAKRLMERHGVELPDTDLAFFSEGTTEFDDYVDAMHWAQDYALANRDAMMAQVLRDLAHHLPAFTVTEAAINCHHNYASLEHHFDREVYVTRKGAIHAGAGELGIIPGSMGTKSYIVRGKGSADSYHSCSHGAGRRMSRTAARKRFTQADILAQTAGVECRKDMAILDEIPAAYKDIDAVMAAQADLVSVVHTLKQVLCVKGD